MDPKLSIIVLCYKAGYSSVSYVSKVIDTIRDIGVDWELILIGNYNKDDKNSDITPIIVEDLARLDDRIKSIVKEKEGMMGWDLRSGLSVATGSHIVFIDGDDQMPATDIKKVWDAINKCNADLVTTYRIKREDGIIRTINSKIFNKMFKLVFPRCNVNDVNSKPKIFSSTLYGKLKLESDNWFIDAEIILQATKHNAKIIQIPTIFYKSHGRKSFVNTATIFEFLVEIVKAKIREI